MSERRRLLPTLVASAAALTACFGHGPSDPERAAKAGETVSSGNGRPEGDAPSPPFGATVDTVFDLIRVSDESAFACLEDMGRAERTVWDKRVDGEPSIDAWLFRGRYRDGLDVEFVVNPELGTSVEVVRAEAERLAPALGRLPSVVRAGLGRVVVHAGAESPHAGPGDADVPGSLTVYADTVDERLARDRLEETLFHEAVHATWETHRLAPDWVAAQGRDPTFLTDYARARPDVEDLPESALFAYALLHHPGRLPPADAADTERAIPNRIAYIARLLPPGEPIFATPDEGAVEGDPDCTP